MPVPVLAGDYPLAVKAVVDERITAAIGGTVQRRNEPRRENKYSTGLGDVLGWSLRRGIPL